MNDGYDTRFPYPDEENIDDYESLLEPETIHVVMVEPGRLAREMDIGTDLYDLQQAVGGGFIETVYWWDEAVCAVVNDEGRLYEALMELTPKRKELIQLLVFDGYSQVDVAEKLGISQGTVWNQWKKIIKILKEAKNE